MTVPPAVSSAGEAGLVLATRATGLLAEFNRAGVLAPADVAVATRLGRLGGEHDETVVLAAALAVRAIRTGSVCVVLADADHTVLGEADQVVDVSALPWPEPGRWEAACAASVLTVGNGPLHLDDGRLYLDRYWRQEELLRSELQARAAAAPPAVDVDRLRADLDRLFPTGTDAAPDRQRLAAAVAALRRVSVLAGGPGTGKTHTVARLLRLLLDQDPTLRIALAAPTGKAAARMEESVREQAGALGSDVTGVSAMTLHRLLGRRPDSRTRFRHDRHRHLPHDVVVVDETSMVSLTLMARLLEALRPDARLVLVGDPDQLASVEAGAVLGDLTRAPGNAEPALTAALRSVGEIDATAASVVHGVVTLEVNHRFRAEIADLAAAIRTGDAERALDLLRSDDPVVALVEGVDLEAREPIGLDELRDDVVAAAREVSTLALSGRTDEALEALDAHRLLCAHRRGPYGVSWWAGRVERWLADDTGQEPGGGDHEWAVGRPLLVTANDYELGLYNGDTGVMVATDDGVRAAFTRGGEPQLVVPARLEDVQTVYAMTVHRAQGSQFERVSVLLPPPESPLLTRELLYTAVTRARQRVRIVGSADAVRAAIARPISRASGLADRLDPSAGPS